MSKERRRNARVQVNLSARYDGLSGKHEARLEDMSLGGCFVNTPGQVSIGEMITVEIKMATGEWLRLRGEVTAHQPGIGFGIIFRFVTIAEERTIRRLISAQSDSRWPV